MTQAKPYLLIVDDDAQLATMLLEYLELQGFAVEAVSNGEIALQCITETPPALIILDVMLPGMNGFDVLTNLRQSYDIPVIMLTARGEEPDRILGLMHGADDYLPKPFNPLELTARVKAILKRAGGSSAHKQTTLNAGPLALNSARKELLVNDKVIALTAAELNVLEQLMRHPDEVISRAQLTEQALNRPLEEYDRSIDTLISKLRNKLAEVEISRSSIRSLRGHGYVLDTAELDSTP